MEPAARAQWVAGQARATGFDLCGVASVDEYLAGVARLQEWLARGYASEMRYLHDPRRSDPRLVLEGARSIVVCALNYNTSLPYSTEASTDADNPRGWVSRYAWGDDYHEILGAKLEVLVAAMRTEFHEPFEALWYVDTGPVVERAAAKATGLGWLAKNTCLINEQLGSWLFLGVILTTLELAPSLRSVEATPVDLCGSCTMCIDACPTGALVEPYVLDARRCISYLTIELRGSIPEEQRAPMGRHVFGCDICQDVCPWNRKAPVTPASRFQPRSVKQENRKGKMENSKSSELFLFLPSLEFLASLAEEDFRRIFQGSPIKRTKLRGLVRNACVALGNALADSSQSAARPGTEACIRITSLLERLAACNDPVVAEHARWALAQMKAG